jgi:hypothetical protein
VRLAVTLVVSSVSEGVIGTWVFWPPTRIAYCDPLPQSLTRTFFSVTCALSNATTVFCG